jgi:hypothetical protein
MVIYFHSFFKGDTYILNPFIGKVWGPIGLPHRNEPKKADISQNLPSYSSRLTIRTQKI